MRASFLRRALTASSLTAALSAGVVVAVAPPGAASTGSTTLYLAAPSSPTLPRAGTLITSIPSTPRAEHTDTDTATGWFELRAGGTSPAAAPASTEPAPTGSGYLWDDTSLEGRSVAAGAWTATVTVAADGALTVVPTARFYRRSAAGAYTAIADARGTATALGSTAQTLTLPSVTAPSVSFGSGDRLYVDLLVQVTKANCCVGNGVVHFDNGGAGQRLVLPEIVGGSAPAPSTSAAPTTTAPTTTAPTTSAPTTTAPTSTAPITTAPTSTAPPGTAPTTTTPTTTTTHTTTATATTTTPTTTASASPTAAAVWRPKPGTSWQWQITGIVDPSLPVQMYDIDLFDAQPARSSYTVAGFGTVNVPMGDNAGIISRLHRDGKTVICYLDTGAWESYRPDAALFPRSVIGNQTYASTGAEWVGEKWLDIRRAAWPAFKPLIAARLDLAKRSGCDGVEPDQNNPWGNRPGFAISLADQKAWYLEVARMAHERGLSVGMKNGIEVTDADTVAAFDWNLNEECRMYSECAVLNQFIRAGKAVFHVEYVDEGMTFATVCPADNAANFDGLLKKLALGTWRRPCR